MYLVNVVRLSLVGANKCSTGRRGEQQRINTAKNETAENESRSKGTREGGRFHHVLSPTFKSTIIEHFIDCNVKGQSREAPNTSASVLRECAFILRNTFSQATVSLCGPDNFLWEG
jgi:hypothetical protein